MLKINYTNKTNLKYKEAKIGVKLNRYMLKKLIISKNANKLLKKIERNSKEDINFVETLKKKYHYFFGEIMKATNGLTDYGVAKKISIDIVLGKENK